MVIESRQWAVNLNPLRIILSLDASLILWVVTRQKYKLLFFIPICPCLVYTN